MATNLVPVGPGYIRG